MQIVHSISSLLYNNNKINIIKLTPTNSDYCTGGGRGGRGYK